MARRRRVLADHKKQGSTLIPPFVHRLRALRTGKTISIRIKAELDVFEGS